MSSLFVLLLVLIILSMGGGAALASLTYKPLRNYEIRESNEK